MALRKIWVGFLHQFLGKYIANAALIFVAAHLYLFTPSTLFAAPFADFFDFIQPDNSVVTLWGEGDEFHADFETSSGHTVVFDIHKKAYFYARLSSDGKSLLSSGVLAHTSSPADVPRHIRADRKTVAALAREKRRLWESDTGLSARWDHLKSKISDAPTDIDSAALSDTATPQSAPPSASTIGEKVGLTLLIDFPDAPATIPQSSIESFLNGDSYTGYSNNGSVKEYFRDVSGGRLTYTNVVTVYIRMSQPKSYYNDTSKDEGERGRLLITDALRILKARSDFESEILPAFDALTVDGSNKVVAFNVFFAGSSSGVWSKGLWPHSWVLASSVSLGNGKSVYKYQITNVGSALSLGTFSHENGHMLCGFPDLYDYESDSKGGAGNFSLMGSGSSLGSGKNPSQVDAYLKLAAGWATVIDLNSSSNLSGTLVAAPNNGYNTLYRYRKPGITTEYFLLENRQKTARDAKLPASGIAVWHVDQLGARDNQSLVPNSSHQNYELTLVQADNLWHFEKNTNSGDSADLYYLGNAAAAYTNHLDDTSSPHGNWWDGSHSGINLNSFSVSGMTMTFYIGLPPAIPGSPTILSVAAGNRQASISFVPPVSDGGRDIISYKVTPNVGPAVTGSEIPIIVPNLTNGVAYSFVISATNAVGTGPNSAVWGNVTPGPVIIDDAETTGYQQLQDAYDADALEKKIKVVSGEVVGDLMVTSANQNGSVLVKGGYDSSFSDDDGPPSVLGNVTLSAGTTRFQNIVVQ